MRSVPECPSVLIENRQRRYSTRLLGSTKSRCSAAENPICDAQWQQRSSLRTERFIGVWRPSTTMRQEELCPLSRFNLSNDHGNDVSAHKSLPISATSSGQRLRDDELNNRNPRRWVRVSSGQ